MFWIDEKLETSQILLSKQYSDLFQVITFHSVDKDECLSNPCQNGGKCEDEINSYTCTCAPGYTGHDCETGITNNLKIKKESFNSFE